MGRLTSLMAMGVSLTSHNSPLLRHLIPSTSWVSRYSSFRRRTLCRNVAFTQGYVGYSTTTNSDGSPQHSDSECDTTVNQVPVPVPRAVGAARWRELANENREKYALIARNLGDSCSFNDSVPVMPDASSCGTSPKIDNGFQPRGSSTTILNKEPTGVMRSGPVPSNNLKVGTNVDVNLKVVVNKVNYVTAQQSQVLKSDISPKAETGYLLKKDDVHLWQIFFANPDEWWDNRNRKKNPQQPDFKHKDTGESLWLSSDMPVRFTKQLERLDQMWNARKAEKERYDADSFSKWD